MTEKRSSGNRLFSILGVIASAFSLFNLYLRVSDQGVWVLFADFVRFYRIIGDFLFGWMFEFLPDFLPLWLAELWLFSFIVAGVIVRAEADVRETLRLIRQTPQKAGRLAQLRTAFTSILRLFFYGLTFLSLILAALSPILLLVTVRLQDQNVIAAAKKAGSREEMKIALLKTVRDEGRDGSAKYLFEIAGIVSHVAWATGMAFVVFAINAYGVSVM